MRIPSRFLAPLAMLTLASSAGATSTLRFTEFVYNSHYQPGNNKASFLEITNVGDSAQDMAGYNVLVNVAGQPNSDFDLSSFGSIAAGESVLVTAAAANLFRADWNLSATTKVLSNSHFSVQSEFDNKLYSAPIDLGNDQLNLVTHFAIGLIGVPGQSSDGHGNQVVAGKFISVNVPLADLDAGGDYINGVWHTVASSLGDGYGSIASVQSDQDIGNPGTYIVPEPSNLAVLSLVGAMMLRRKRLQPCS